MVNNAKAQDVVAFFLTLLLGASMALMGCRSDSKKEFSSNRNDIQAPIELKIATLEDSLMLHLDQHLVTEVVSLYPVKRLNCTVLSSGIVSVSTDKHYSWKQIDQKDTLVIETSFSLDGEGEGALRVSAQVINDEGDTLYERTATIYFLADEGYLLMDSTSPLLLKRQLLSRLLESGKISRSEYDERLERLLGQGAFEESNISADSQ